MLGDPGFHPYSSQTGETKWEARGGLLRLSLEEVGHRFGEEIAQDVVRCAKELDRYDASRRVGVELPWHPMEDRELEPAEVSMAVANAMKMFRDLTLLCHAARSGEMDTMGDAEDGLATLGLSGGMDCTLPPWCPACSLAPCEDKGDRRCT
eukprot:symbB.v1.2.034628.t1/scaffold4503.1/size38817/6